ncbi:MAG: helix-turn-helix domain-containing protein [Myxococcota bacterium]
MNDSPREYSHTPAEARQTVGHNIRRLRKSQELSQEQLSFQAGINRAYLSTVENGKRNISIENIFAVADALDVDPRELLRPMDEDD